MHPEHHEGPTRLPRIGDIFYFNGIPYAYVGKSKYGLHMGQDILSLVIYPFPILITFIWDSKEAIWQVRLS